MNAIDVIKNDLNGSSLNLINRISVLRKANWGMSDAEQIPDIQNNDKNAEPDYE